MYNIVNPIFYTLKPFIPRLVQIFLRRFIAKYQLKKYEQLWPIDPNSANQPEGWQGWPDEKQFAFVLNHDVDSLNGYKNVLMLADIEESYGFRSTFNFVPERYGPISSNLLDELRERGFDVGVRGLKHDGKLFLSKRCFDRRSSKINNYLKKWKTCGFSSPSMHHNLKWLTELNIDYSISTFDTDPFEPEPDAVGTLFPFWVKNGLLDKGYVELPYTLPQDSTLFIILKNKTIDIWKRKLEWIADHGGMALVNTHPDYMDLNKDRSKHLEYPCKYYIDFLEHVRKNYQDCYWHSLPGEVARFWQSLESKKWKNP